MEKNPSLAASETEMKAAMERDVLFKNVTMDCLDAVKSHQTTRSITCSQKKLDKSASPEGGSPTQESQPQHQRSKVVPKKNLSSKVK